MTYYPDDAQIMVYTMGDVVDDGKGLKAIAKIFAISPKLLEDSPALEAFKKQMQAYEEVYLQAVKKQQEQAEAAYFMSGLGLKVVVDEVVMKPGEWGVFTHLNPPGGPDDPYNKPYSHIVALVPGLGTVWKDQCPVVGCTYYDHYAEPELADVVMHLNDRHKWTREQIADWLDQADVDLSVKEKEVNDDDHGDDGTCTTGDPGCPVCAERRGPGGDHPAPDAH